MSKPPTALDTRSAIPLTTQEQLDRGYGASSTPRSQHLAATGAATDFGSTPGNPSDSSPLAQSTAQHNYGRFNEEWDASQRGSSIIDGPLHRSNSMVSQGDTLLPSRGGTLKKKPSLRRAGSLKRSSSRRSSRAGSVRSLALHPAVVVDEMHSAFFSPVPTSGNPTDILANRFQAWRKLLKDLITYFREIQTQYDNRAKSMLKISNVINNTTSPSMFLSSGGLDDALQILRGYHKIAIAEANKSKEIENDVILALAGLRSDLNLKIKEIKNLSGDFKNSVEKEMESTRRVVNNLQEGLGQADIDPAQMTGRQDPYLLRLAADRQVEKQIDEENYLHQAYLNLEASGRELEAIVVGEIQKSYNAIAGILKREADASYSTVDELRTRPIAMPKDHEWNTFIEDDEHFVDPRIPVREAQNIQYPGRDNELASEVRAGLLERKSKYLKSYTPGWYVLSPTHLHEFKSADKSQAPIMSLYLPEQKLGSHSSEGGSSNKFMLKGRQTGSMHRGHSWVFRAESHETMMAWYEDLSVLIDKSPQERNAFVRQHARSRSMSGSSQKAGSVSSDGVMDEEDEDAFGSSATATAIIAQGHGPKQDVLPRPQPGGRFPSDLSENQHGLQAPLSPSSGSSGFGDVVGQKYGEAPTGYGDIPTSHAALVTQQAMEDGVNPYTYKPIENTRTSQPEDFNPSGMVDRALTAAVLPGSEHSRHPDDQAGEDQATLLSFDTHSTYARQSEQRAVGAAAAGKVEAPNTPKDSKAILGGRSLSAVAPAMAANAEPQCHSREVPSSVDAAQQPLASDLTRPTLPNHISATSISQLHVPGEYPRNNTDLKEANGFQ